jgi:hypothetical protein
MKRFSYTAFLSAGVLFAGLASAQTFDGPYFHDPQRDDPYYRNGRVYRDDPYYRNGRVYRDDPYYRNGRVYDDDDYDRPRDRYRNDRFGYGRNTASLIGQVMSDIDRAASNARLDGHEARHFNEAVQKLQEFQSRWDRGKFDTGRLDKAIDNMQHLVNADRVHPRDRDILSRDLSALREFRSSGGQYGAYGDYGNGRYNRNNRRYPTW